MRIITIVLFCALCAVRPGDATTYRITKDTVIKSQAGMPSGNAEVYRAMLRFGGGGTLVQDGNLETSSRGGQIVIDEGTELITPPGMTLILRALDSEDDYPSSEPSDDEVCPCCGAHCCCCHTPPALPPDVVLPPHDGHVRPGGDRWHHEPIPVRPKNICFRNFDTYAQIASVFTEQETDQRIATWGAAFYVLGMHNGNYLAGPPLALSVYHPTTLTPTGEVVETNYPFDQIQIPKFLEALVELTRYRPREFARVLNETLSAIDPVASPIQVAPMSYITNVAADIDLDVIREVSYVSKCERVDTTFSYHWRRSMWMLTHRDQLIPRGIEWPRFGEFLVNEVPESRYRYALTRLDTELPAKPVIYRIHTRGGSRDITTIPVGIGPGLDVEGTPENGYWVMVENLPAELTELRPIDSLLRAIGVRGAWVKQGSM
ncbi:MAG: hypothetical protein LBJ69_01560 [Holosporales bacterium]|jgi:hypothetical protein|nr:hypothetical protein [Holosporales bacterium]